MITTFTTHITPYNLDRTIYLYLPDDWQSGKRYPVLYMYDGHNLFSNKTATFGTCWGLKDYLDAHPNYIVVGQDCNHEGNKRLEEYCPYTVSAFGGITGTGKTYMKWLVDELKPFIDEHYPTLPERANTAIGGSSMGGLMSLYSVLAYNDTFSKAACLSPSSIICLDEMASELDQASIAPDTRIYMSWGEKEAKGQKYFAENVNKTAKFISDAERKGADVMLYMQPQGTHCEACWAAQVPQFMDYLFSNDAPSK